MRGRAVFARFGVAWAAPELGGAAWGAGVVAWVAVASAAEDSSTQAACGTYTQRVIIKIFFF